jgi:hypothetical protein
MTVTILLMAAAYALVSALLLLILINTRLPLAIKLLASLATIIMIPWTYFSIGELRGLPTDSKPPTYFKLHWARVVEPNLLMKEKGHVFLWLEELDAQNFPSGVPRAYGLAYDPELVKKVEVALGKIQDGEDVAGTITDAASAPVGDTAESLARKVKDGARPGGPNSGSVGERFFEFDPSMLTFGEAAAPITPEKDQ